MSPSARRYLFTSESVTEGHPDKIADQISDSVLDAVLEQDSHGRVACEALVTTGLALVAGEITTKAHFDYTKITRDTIRRIGYTDARWGFDADGCAVLVAGKEQSPDLAMGVDPGGGGRGQGGRVGQAQRRGENRNRPRRHSRESHPPHHPRRHARQENQVPH